LVCRKASRLLGRSRRRLLLLAPSSTASRFFRVHHDPQRHGQSIAELQTLRGNVYVQQSSLRSEQLTAGRHRVSIDEGSWHLLLVDECERICGCLRYRECRNDISYPQLSVSHSALAHCLDWGEQLKTAVQEELAFARRVRLPYVELGGWALARNIRGTSEALRMALGAYALAQLIGGATGIATARQSGSASILRRIGGSALECAGRKLPAYHDPAYRCLIEVLRFCSWEPNPRFRGWIEEIKAELREARVLIGGAAPPEWMASRESHAIFTGGMARAAMAAAS
jgi:hypothetical protein